jgi:DNA-binding CsgD family transcriptional regulator
MPVDDPLSRSAEEAYERLLAAGELPVTGTPEEAELLAAGLAYRGGEFDAVLRPVSRRRGTQILLDRQHARLAEDQARLVRTWRRFSALADGLSGVAGADAPDGVTPIATLPDAATRAAELYGSARIMLRATFTAAYTNQPTERRTLLPPDGSPAEFRAIYDTEFASSRWGADIITQSIQAGERVRVRRTVPTKMILVDDRIALLAVRSDGSQALEVRAPDLLVLLGEWFDLMWRDPATSSPAGTATADLTAMQRTVLRQLAQGRSDKQIAQSCGVTIRTVSRHVATILAELGVETRFAAGAAAARRGWV